MSENYYCDYCDKRMKNDVNVRKKHNEGLPHKIEKAVHAASVRDPQETLELELGKSPCPRFIRGRECRFGLLCHYSHYTPDQILELRQIVAAMPKKSAVEIELNMSKLDTQKLPWTYSKYQIPNKTLPASLQPIQFNIAWNLKPWG